MERRQSTRKPMILYLLFFLLLSLGHHAYRFWELQCIQVQGIGFWTHTLYEILGNLGLYGYNRYPFSNHAPAISEKYYFQPTSIFRQPGVETESMAPPTSKSRPYGGMNVYLLAFIAAFMAPIVAALSIKIKLVLCAFVTSVLTTSMALVSAIIGWDLISEFLSEIALTSPFYVPFAMMLFAPALATYYLALGHRIPVCLFDFTLYHIPYENSLFSSRAIEEKPRMDEGSTRPFFSNFHRKPDGWAVVPDKTQVPHEDEDDIEEISREDLNQEISGIDLARLDQSYNNSVVPWRTTRTGHQRLKIDDLPLPPANLTTSTEFSEYSDSDLQIPTPLIYPSSHERNQKLFQGNSSTPDKVMSIFQPLSFPSAVMKPRASPIANPREQLILIPNIMHNIPLTQALVFKIAVFAPPAQLTHSIPWSREIVIRFDLREVVNRWWSTQLSEATSRTMAFQQVVRYFDLPAFVETWAKRNAFKFEVTYTKSQKLLLSLCARQACFLELEYAPIVSTYLQAFTGFPITHLLSAITQTSDKLPHQPDTLSLKTSPTHTETPAQSLAETGVHDHVLSKVGPKLLNNIEKSEDRASLETNSTSEVQLPSENNSPPQVRRRRRLSLSTMAQVSNAETDSIRELRRRRLLSPTTRARVRNGFFPPHIRRNRPAAMDAPADAVSDSIPSDKQTSRDQSANDSQPQPNLHDQVPAITTSGLPTSVTDGAAGDFAEVAEGDHIPSLPASVFPTAVIDGAAGDFSEVADYGKDGASDGPGQQHPASLDHSSYTTGPTTSVSDGAAVGFAVVDEGDQGDAEQALSSPLHVDADSKKTVKKGKKKGKGKKKSKEKQREICRRLFDEHRCSLEREGEIDLDLLTDLSNGMNGKDITDVFFRVDDILAEDKRSKVSQADFEEAIAQQRQKMMAGETYSTRPTSSKASNTPGSLETQKNPGSSSSAASETSDDEPLQLPDSSTTTTSKEAPDTSGSESQPPSSTTGTADASGSTPSSSLKPSPPAGSEPSHLPKAQAPSKQSNGKGAIGALGSSGPKSSPTSDTSNSSTPKAPSGSSDSKNVTSSAAHSAVEHSSTSNSVSSPSTAKQDSGKKSSSTSASDSTSSPGSQSTHAFDSTDSLSSKAPGSLLETPDASTPITHPDSEPIIPPASKEPIQTPSWGPRLPPGPIFSRFPVSQPLSNDAENASSREPKISFGYDYDVPGPSTVWNTAGFTKLPSYEFAGSDTPAVMKFSSGETPSSGKMLSPKKSGKPSSKSPGKPTNVEFNKPSTRKAAKITQKPLPIFDTSKLPPCTPAWSSDSTKCDPAQGTSEDKGAKAFDLGAPPADSVDFSTSPPNNNFFNLPEVPPTPTEKVKFDKNNFFDLPVVPPTPTEKVNFEQPSPQPDPISSEPPPPFTSMSNLGKPVSEQDSNNLGQAPTSTGNDGKPSASRRIAKPRGKSILARLQALVAAINVDRTKRAYFDGTVQLDQLALRMAGFTTDQIQSVINIAIEFAATTDFCIASHSDLEQAIDLIKWNIEEGTKAESVPNDAAAAPPSAAARNKLYIPNGRIRIEIFRTFMPESMPEFLRSHLISYHPLRDQTKDFTREDCEEVVKLAIQGAIEDNGTYICQEHFERAIKNRRMTRSRRAPL